MEHDQNLRILREKTLDLHGKISEKITQKAFSFCSHCSSHGRYCVVTGSTAEGREKIIALRDSLRDFHDILVYLQRLKSSHEKQWEQALDHLEKSRMFLIETIKQFPEKQRNAGLLEELITFLRGEKADEFSWDFKGNSSGNDERKPAKKLSFLVRTAWFVLEFALVFASIFAGVELCKNRQERVGSGSTKPVARMDSGNFEFLLRGDNINLDVSCGRG